METEKKAKESKKEKEKKPEKKEQIPLNKDTFIADVLRLLARYGYKTGGMKNAVITCSRDNLPEVKLDYFQI